ncbi:unnamed protein product [Heterobilharzia americana]|nr:unnamed protein product [Heterobilharzia americana]
MFAFKLHYYISSYPDSMQFLTSCLLMILFVFKVGHSVQRKPKPVNGRTHHWRCYVDSWNPRYPLSAFVKKVTFKLHNTFENPRQVVRQAPFAIEEDGFGTFQLQIEVAFLDCVTTFYYDLTLFDQNALHTYRTIQLDPAPEDWDKLIQLGGIAVPRTSNQCTVHEIVQTIQSYSDLESLHPFSFYPELESTKKSTNKDKLATSTSQAKMHDYSKTDAYSDVNHSLQVSSSSSSSDRLLTNQFLPQKHKKKLQLLHEAQLLLEKAQQSQNWAPVISPPPPQIQPPMITNINSPEGSHMPSPDPSTWSSHFSPSRSSLHEQTDIVEQDHHSYKSQKSPVVHFHRKITKDTPFMKSPKSDPTKISYVVDSNKQENSAPKQRIVLKLSRSSCGSQLSVSSSQPLDDEFAVEKLDRKKHKKESKKERHDKSSRGSSSKHSLTNRPNTTVSTTVAGMSDKDMIETHIMSKLSSQIFSSETSSTSSKKHYSPRKYSSRDTCSNNSSPRLVYSQRKSGNASPKIRSEISSSESHSNKSNSDASMLGSANVKEDSLKLSKKGEENELSHRVSQQQRLKHQYSPMNELQQVGKDAFTSDADSLGDSYSRSTHSHLLLLDQKDDDYHDGCFPNDSGRETPVVDYFGDEMQQQREQHSTSVPHSIPPPAILSSSNVRNFRYADELSVVSGHNPGYSAASDGGSSRPYDPEERLTHSVAATSSELYEEDFDDFTPPKTYSTSDELNKPTNQILASKFTDQKCVKRSKIDSDESQLSLGKSKQYIDDKTESRLSKKSKIKISANSSNKCLSYSDVDFNKSIDPNIPAKQPKILNLSKSSDDRQSKSLSLSDSHSVEVHNRQKSSVKKFKSYDKSSCKPSITTVDHTKQFENSPGHNKTCLSSKDKGVKHTNKSTKNDRQPESSSKVSSEYETFSSISISGTQKSSKVLNSTETKKPTKPKK